MNIEIIKLPVERWVEYKALRLRALKEEPQAFGSSYADQVTFADDKWQARVRDAFEEKTNWMLFAQSEGKLVGMTAGFQSPEDLKSNTANIISVYVASEARGQGISRLLMEGIIKTITEGRTVSKLRLSVNKDQAPAVKLYESFGFKKVGEENNKMGDGDTYTEYVMEKTLDSGSSPE